MKNSNNNLKEKSINLSQLESISGGEANQTGVKYKINGYCIDCSTCVGECPVDAIIETNGRYKGGFQIDYSICTGCGVCVNGCPVGAIEKI